MKLERTTNQYQSQYFDEQSKLVATLDKHGHGRIPSGIVRIKLPDGKNATHIISGQGKDTDSVENVSRMIDELLLDLVIPHGKTAKDGLSRKEFLALNPEQRQERLKDVSVRSEQGEALRAERI